MSKKKYRNLPAAVYVIHNTITNRSYIGQSTGYPSRWSRHKTDLRHNRHGNSSLQRDWNDYGEEAFRFEVIREYPHDTECDILLDREQEVIDEYLAENKDLYNVYYYGDYYSDIIKDSL
jgi:group I intron endonuclease